MARVNSIRFTLELLSCRSRDPRIGAPIPMIVDGAPGCTAAVAGGAPHTRPGRRWMIPEPGVATGDQGPNYTLSGNFTRPVRYMERCRQS
jgi:hypothetical protein